jgi:hypothetical protein
VESEQGKGDDDDGASGTVGHVGRHAGLFGASTGRVPGTSVSS